MLRRTSLLLFIAATVAPAVIIDRIAIVVGNSIIKDSDIERDIRVTAFLNGSSIDLSNASRKKASSRLIDQIFIRREIELGNYPITSMQTADQELQKLKSERYKTDRTFREKLREYDLSELDLRTQFQWQLTVLQFIDLRFRPAVLVSDDEIQKYYQSHSAVLQRSHPEESKQELRDEARTIVTGEKVNEQFFAWLDEQRHDARIQFLEESLG